MELIEKITPSKLLPYIRLMRLDKPVGTLLVLFPCWWGIALASKREFDLWIVIAFTLGAILMRSAGCIVNDLADQQFDKHVDRTKSRPLANGDLNDKQAVTLLIILLLLSACILFTLPLPAIILGIFALLPMIFYPYTKRFTFWPQFFLGISINWGVLMAYAAIHESYIPTMPIMLLYIGCIFWTLGYDTIYAHQDREDDEKLGLKSTALLLGEATPEYVTWFYKSAMIFMAIAALSSHYSLLFYPILALAAWLILHNLRRLDITNREHCGKHFKAQMLYGSIITVAFIVGQLF